MHAASFGVYQLVGAPDMESQRRANPGSTLGMSRA